MYDTDSQHPYISGVRHIYLPLYTAPPNRYLGLNSQIVPFPAALGTLPFDDAVYLSPTPALLPQNALTRQVFNTGIR